MIIQIKSRIYPNFYQKLTLDNHFDAYRFVYNLCQQLNTYNFEGDSFEYYPNEDKLDKWKPVKIKE